MATDAQHDEAPKATLQQPDYETIGAEEIATLVQDQMKSKVSALRDRLHRLVGEPHSDDTASTA
jgi:hypothetical protein